MLAKYTGNWPKKTSGGSVSDVVLAGHYTIGKADECPTEAFDIHGALGWKDMAVIAPDYYGFGSTSKAAQAYLMLDATAVECLDAMLLQTREGLPCGD